LGRVEKGRVEASDLGLDVVHREAHVVEAHLLEPLDAGIGQRLRVPIALRAHGVVMRNELMDFHSRKLILVEGTEGITVELAQWAEPARPPASGRSSEGPAFGRNRKPSLPASCSHDPPQPSTSFHSDDLLVVRHHVDAAT
jgi:hypothetical protein